MSVERSTIAAIRFGYGFHPDQAPPRGSDDLLRQLRNGASADVVLPVATRLERRALREEVRRAQRQRKRPDATKADDDAYRVKIRHMKTEGLRDVVRRVFQRALSPNSLYERMAAFWADHFAIAAKSIGQLYLVPTFEIDAIRPHVMGHFSDMLEAVVHHPVMLIYLDQVASIGPNSRAGLRTGKGLNENLAREILELHTLGVGGPYTQTDVREFAKLLTGYTTRQGFTHFRFLPKRAEPGAETIMGRRYGGDPPSPEHAVEFLHDLARHKVTAQHLARKLAVHFVSDNPDPDLVRHIAGAWQRGGGHLPPVYHALLEHPAAWRDFGAKVKRPVDLVASTLRALGAGQPAADRALKRPHRLFRALKGMNQPMFQPPGPDGWPEEAEAWITPQGLAARIEYASRTGQLIAKSTRLDPRDFARQALRDTLRPDTAFAVRAAPDRWEGFAFALASPEFNRR